jgi:hypothetical protein
MDTILAMEIQVATAGQTSLLMALPAVVSG